MDVVVQFVNKSSKGVVRHPALFSFFKQFAKGRKLGFLLFQQAQGCTNYFASGGKSPFFQLLVNKSLKVGAKSNAGIFAHLINLKAVPIIGIVVEHNEKG